MLTKKQNLLETIHGGKPDRYVNQYEFMHTLLSDPFNLYDPYPEYGQLNVVNEWGVTLSWPEGTPGPFPVHDDAHKVLKDITEWRNIIKAPNLIYPDSAWETAIKEVEEVDKEDQFVAPMIAPGIFERLHYFMGMEDSMINFYEEPEIMADLIKYITDWELQYAETLCDHLHPDALFHHDDWGSQRSLFISKEMFDEFLLPAYKKIYGYWKANGVEVIIHHSDSYAADLVPEMIEMGVDVFQGVVGTNNIPELIKQYGGQITFMGGLDNGIYDMQDWTREKVRTGMKKLLEEAGPRYLIPGLTMGGPESTYPGLYEAVSEIAGEFDAIYFPLKK